MTSRSLRVRLLIGAAAAVFVALAASWVAMTLLFQRHIERRVESELTRDARQLVSGLSVDVAGKVYADLVPSDSRFNDPASGLYWQLSSDSAALRSRSLWDQRLPPSHAAQGTDWTTRYVDGPFNQRVMVLERVVQPERDRSAVLVQVALNEETIQSARREFGRELALFLGLLWLILSGAAWVQVQLGLRPLRRVRNELDELRSSPAARLSDQHPPEIEPLTRAINALADAREKDLAAARRRAADLAHGLKTPLAALSAESRRAREAGALEAAEGLDRAIAAAAAAVEAELTRSRAATIRQASRHVRTFPQPVIERIIGVIERTDFGAQRVFEVEVPDDLQVPVAPDDLTELMGALMENAARFARRRVRISGTAQDITLTVEDDGPGLEQGRAEHVLTRGGRLDEAGPGHGLGLSIARELAEASGGSLSLNPSPLGGLCVSVRWPRA